MKNACIILKNAVNADMGASSAVINAFSVGGYSFDEIHILSQSGSTNLTEYLKAFKTDNGIVVLLAEEALLPSLKMFLLKTYPSTALKYTFASMAVFEENASVIFLLPTDNAQTSAEYVKEICLPYLQKSKGVAYTARIIRTIGANTSRLQSLLEEIQDEFGGNIRCVHLSANGEDTLHLVYNNQVSKERIDWLFSKILEVLGDTVYALSDYSIEKMLIELLKARQLKISVAESFTGGGIAKRLTSVSGASEVYFEGLNTYNEYSKVKRLGVCEDTLNAVGAVSDKTAYEMACGLLATGDCDIALATTGIAGPNSDAFGTPVGLCYLAIGTKERIRVYRYAFDGTRQDITEKAINYALYHAYKEVKNYKNEKNN